VNNRFFLAVSALLLGACDGPNTNRPVALLKPDSSLCNQPPLVVELRAGREYAANNTPLDSSALVGWLQMTLPQRRADQRRVFVWIDSSRTAADLEWIVPTIERWGGRAYAAEITCTYTDYSRQAA
jgi:hypothetical protein